MNATKRIVLQYSDLNSLKNALKRIALRGCYLFVGFWPTVLEVVQDYVPGC